jgi:RNA polymerase sigma factor (TIGR02999 family)
MDDEERADITQLLELAGGGDGEASRRVFALLYDELRRLAAAQRARVRAGDTLNTTAVVHEAFLKLVGREGVSFNGRHHFFCTAARSMRDILVDEARRKTSRKRGGDLQRVELFDVEDRIPVTPEQMIDLDNALRKLEADHADDYQIVMLRYFTGLTVPEVADVLGVAQRTVERRWRFCRSWLTRELGTEPLTDG